MKLKSRTGWLLASSATAVLLAACGGGGGAGSTEQASARKGNAGVSQPVPALAMAEERAPSQSARSDGEREASGNPAGRAASLYIVQLADDPALVYNGGVAGLQATRPAAGKKIDPNSPAVLNYADYLSKKHDATLASVGGSGKAYSYVYVYNGFAAALTEAQAAALAGQAGVLSVVKDERRQLDTATTPNFLGLTKPDGLWNVPGAKGENVIIGIIDGGITPEHPSFSDRTDTNGNGTKDGKLGYQQIPGWNGKCQPGDAFNGSHCNQKLIGARYYNQGYGGGEGVLALLPYEFISPRDYDGHGTHTASTAGGNQNVEVAGPLGVFGKISGMAPRARIAAYKVCWGIGGTANAGCSSVDSVAAIDQAIADGVDVINYSISGSRTNFRDPVEIAFLRAAQAGVFVAASAGNAGPTSSTVAHPSPWITTVAAGTHTRDATASVLLGNGASYVGSSTTTTSTAQVAFIDSTQASATPFASLSASDQAGLRLCVSSADVADPTIITGGARPTAAALLDPAKVAGKIVLCDRGVTARVNKSAAVAAAGGVGMVLVNTSANTLNTDVHSVPSVHVSHTFRPALQAYAATPGATAQIVGPATVVENPALGPTVASFSSRGALQAGNGDLLKPDIIAPGQDILAGVAPYTYGGSYFGLLSGTSMSSPHIAGIAALFKEARPQWSPMAIKSALMTSAGDLISNAPATVTELNLEPNARQIFRQGAGHVQPNNALNPGLVFDSNFADWLGFLCGTQLPVSFCTDAGVPVIDPSNFNGASIAIGDMAGVQTVTRRVTNVGNQNATYTLSHTGMTGVTVEYPATLDVPRGETRTFTVKFTRGTAALNGYGGGQLRLTAGTTVVRVPMVIRPVALGAPTQVGGNYNVTFGFNGPFTATPRGLIEAAITAGTVPDDPTNGDCTLNSPNAQKFDIPVPASTTYARFSLFDADVNVGADIDLCVFNGTTLVGTSGSGTSAEEVNLLNPAPGTYTVVVQGWGVVGSSPFKLHTWLLGTTAAGNMTVSAPADATIGATGNIVIGLPPPGLTPGKRYLGSVAYGGAAGLPNPTIVRIDP